MNLRLLTVIALCLVAGLTIVQAQVPTPPPIPQNLVVVPVPNTPSGAKLMWDAPPGPWAFRVYRSMNDTSHFMTVGGSQSHTFINYGLMAGHTYYYCVTSLVFQNNGVIESPRSAIVAFTPGAGPTPHPKGFITGTVTDDSTGLPIRGARVRFFRMPSAHNWMPQAITDSAGHYRAVLDTGTYLLKAEGFGPSPMMPPYIPEWYNNAPDPSTATPVAVAESSMFIADFGLARLAPPTFAYVNGIVTDTLGNPLRGATVAFMRTMQEVIASEALTGDALSDETVTIEGLGHTPSVCWRGRTDSLGRYRARVIAGRDYIAMAVKLGYLPEYFNNKPTPATADVITVGGDTSGIDFSLALNPVLQNSITGLVRDSAGVGVASRLILLPLRNTPGPHAWGIRYGHTDSLGNYSINNVPTGRYFVLAIPFRTYAPAFYKAGAYGVIRWQDADTVQISGAVSGIDVGVVRIHNGGFATVRGRVVAGDGSALAGVNVFAFAGDAIAAYTITDANGGYSLAALPPGRLRILADREGYNAGETELSVTSLLHSNVNLVLSPALVLSVGPAGTPDRFTLEQNYPNPFNPTTTISFTMPAAGTATLRVYSLIGQEVATLVNGPVSAGPNSVVWNGRDVAGRSLSSGLYFYRLRATAGGQEFNLMRKMVLMK